MSPDDSLETLAAISRYERTGTAPSARAGRSGSQRALRRRSCTRFMQAEEAAGVSRRVGGELLYGTAERARHGARDVRQEGGLVPARLGLRPEVARRQIGGVGLEDQPVAGDFLDEIQKMAPAALVADPAGDAHVEVELQVGAQFVALAGEAVRHRALDLVMLQDLVEARVRVCLLY